MLFNNNILFLKDTDSINEIREYLFNLILKDDDTNSHEIFSLSLFIMALFKLNKINFPVEIEKRQSPDFFYRDNSVEIGIEHTRATIGQYKIALKELKKKPIGSTLELSFYSPFKKLSNKNSDIGIRVPSEDLNGIGWYGDLAEIEWSEIFSRIIKSKTMLLNTVNFQKYKLNDLIIEDETPVDFIINLEKGIKFLNNLISEFYQGNDFLHFDRIHIFSVNNFIFDVLNKKIIINLRKRNL